MLILARTQRILSAIELFALVLWVGGLFFLGTFAPPIISQTLQPDQDAAWRVARAIIGKFNSIEMIFAIVVLASNFLKVTVFSSISQLQRYALLVSAIMLIFTFAYAHIARPRMDEKMVEIATLNPPMKSRERQQFEKLYQEYQFLVGVNLMLGFFMVYAYRSFEEHKLQALARIIKPQ